MFQAISRMLNNSNISTNTNIKIAPTNAINPEILDTTSNTMLSNNVALELLTTLMKNSPNTIIKIIYQIVRDNPYAIFLFVVMSIFCLTMIIRFIVYVSTKRKAVLHKNVYQRFWKVFLSPQFIWTGLLLGIIVGVDVLKFPASLAHFIKGCLLSILSWIFYSIIQKILYLYSRTILIFSFRPGARMKIFKNRNLFIVLSRTANATWFLIFITILLGLWGVELGPILAGLGIVGIVVGLALQDTLSHILGGVSLMLDETYSEGDYILLDNGTEGIIFQIGYRSTRLRTFNDEIIIIPNGVLAKMMITNLSQPIKRVRMKKFYKTLAKNADPQTVKNLLVQAAQNIPAVLKYPEPDAFFIEPQGSLYLFRLTFFVSSPLNQLSVNDAVQQEIVRLCKENNIYFAVDESVVHLNHPT